MPETLITHLAAPSAGEFNVSGADFSAYRRLQLILAGVRITTDDDAVYLRFRVSGSVVTSGYRWGRTARIIGSAGAGQTGDASDPSIPLTAKSAGEDLGNATAATLFAIVNIFAPADSGLHRCVTYQSVWQEDGGRAVGMAGHGYLENTGAIDGINIIGDSALVAGNFTLTGIGLL